MKKMIKNLTFKLIDATKERKNEFSSTIGFDGYVDKIYRVVKHRYNHAEYDLFQTMQEFVGYIQKNAGRSSDLEILWQGDKIGGNAPLLADALAKLGSKANCIGTFGQEELHRVFKGISPNCSLKSIGEPSVTHAFEFNDGKLMFGQTESLHQINWQKIKKDIGLETMRRLIETSRLVGIVNWSATIQMASILEGILTEVFPLVRAEPQKTRYCLFDIADPSRRRTEELKGFLETINRFSEYSKVILGLNEKEAGIVFQVLKPEGREQDFLQIGKAIFDSLQIECLVIHKTKSAIGFSGDEIEEVPTFYVNNPKISTGSGDNFNAGFSLGRLLGYSLRESLVLGNAVSSFYVANGYSPAIQELVRFLLEKADEDL